MLPIIKKITLKATSALALIAAILAGSVSPASAEFASVAVRSATQDTDAIAVNPATDGTADKSRTRFEYQLNSGQPARDSIYVVNTGTSVQDVTLYARDAFADAKGDFLIQDQSVQPTDVGAWVEFSGGNSEFKFTLKPRGFMTIPFDVLTPSNATPGDHVGAIVASAVTKGSNINIVRRVAVRLYARLSGQLKARLQLENVTSQTFVNPFNPFASNNVVSYDITNVGNVELSADVSVKTDGPLGLFGGSTESVRLSNLLPGSTRHVTQTVPGAGQLAYSSTTVIYTGLLTSTTVAAQQPRGRADLTNLTMPTGWFFWLGALGLVWLLAAKLKRSVKSQKSRRLEREKTD